LGAEQTNTHPESKYARRMLNSPTLWGHYFWVILHNASLLYTEEMKKRSVTFLQIFASVLPCRSCSSDFSTLLMKHPFIGKTRRDFVQYVVMIHGRVSARLKKFDQSAFREIKPGETPEEYLSSLDFLYERNVRGYDKYFVAKKSKRTSLSFLFQP
jgi:hypothetical protein